MAGTMGVCATRILAALAIQDQEIKGELSKGGWGGAGKETKKDRRWKAPWYLENSLLVPPRDAGRGGLGSLLSTCPDPTGTKLIFSCYVKQNQGTKVPHSLTFWGVHRLVSFSYPMRSWNILYPLEKKCKSESQAFVSMTTGGPYFGKSEFIYIQINISVYDSGTFLHEIFQNHIECCSHAKNLRIKMKANFKVYRAPRFRDGFISKNEKEW